VKRILKKANVQTTVGLSAAIISASYLLSRLLGLFRDRLLISTFGKGPTLDAYNAAFTLPDLLFTLLVSGAFAVAFIPVFSEYLKKDEKKMAWDVAASLLNLLVLGTIAIALVVQVFAVPITEFLFHGFDAETIELTANLTRIMLITPTLFAISSVWGSIQQAHNRFVLYALASVMYNVGIIAGIMLFTGKYGIYGVAIGVVIGCVAQALMQFLGMAGLGYRWRPIMSFKLKGVRKTIKLIIPRSIDQGMNQINYAIEKSIGSVLGAGAITSFTYANNLRNVPLTLIGSAITTAVFPRLAERASDKSKERLIESFVYTARLILFLSIPAAILSVVARGYIVRLLYGFGDADTANILGWFAASIIFISLYFLVSRVFYAMQDTKTPLFVSIGSVVVNIALSFYLSAVMGITGLAAAASIVAALQVGVLTIVLKYRLGSIGGKGLFWSFARMSFGGMVMAFSVRYMIQNVVPLYADDLGFTTIAPKFLLIMLVAAATYLIPCYVLRVREAKLMIHRLADTLLRPLDLT
jgi:putative peptidoglycan lipid II flippase